ncbi:unnamed protein product [Mesocestoides corti]|uniref:SH3 domain-containing protein n=1 Tax=Mesocestoides corti TaxID=53468 RepID=A0A0R3UMB9_MESCO|nr:unnamed protein product [Mesocestoides corti]
MDSWWSGCMSAPASTSSICHQTTRRSTSLSQGVFRPLRQCQICTVLSFLT